MKIYKYLLLCFCLFSLTAQAQKGAHLGVTGGVIATGMLDEIKYGDVDYDYKLTIGSSYGIAGGYNFSDYLGIQSELNFAKEGAVVKIHESNYDITKDFTLNYLQVPVMFRLSGGNYNNRFTAMFGPQWSFLSSANVFTEDKVNGNSSKDISSRFNKTDIGLVLSGGGDITLKGNWYLNTELRFYYGMTQVNKDKDVILEKPNEEDLLKNVYGGLFIGLHYMFR